MVQDHVPIYRHLLMPYTRLAQAVVFVPALRLTLPTRVLFHDYDYICDTGSHHHYASEWYTTDALWDGAGYGGCCEFNSPPRFCKDLPESTTDEIEMQVCKDEDTSSNDKNVGVEMVNIIHPIVVEQLLFYKCTGTPIMQLCFSYM